MSTEGSDRQSILANVRDIVFIATIYVGFAGFCYSYAYNEQFGIPTTIDASKVGTVIVYAYNVLTWGSGQLVRQRIPLAFVVAAWIALALSWSKIPIIVRYHAKVMLRRLGRPPVLRTIVWLVAILAFPILGSISMSAGSSLANARRSSVGTGRAFVTLKKDSQVLSDAKVLLALGSASLLGDREDQVAFLVQEPPAVKNGSLPAGKVILIPKADVSTLIISVP